ncbi:MAG TPA: hypothetical protein VGN90_02635 [Pyrinomonadaceae bacterium]|nr:hypothetical protein [Pyrinomonadaceae bacterium]
MNIQPLKKCAVFAVFISLALLPLTSFAKRRAPTGGRVAVVIDERLSALRNMPELSGVLLRRLGRGALVAIRGEKRSRDGAVFYRVNVTSRTNGWVQREALVTPSRTGDDARLLRLIKGSEDFDRIGRARIFLEAFTSSKFRPEVLMIYAHAAEDAAARLSREASRRLDDEEMAAGGAPLFTYFLNYNGLDRYNRQGITFVFDAREKRFRYDGEAWQELVHRYPQSPEAAEARKKLEALRSQMTRQ